MHYGDCRFINYKPAFQLFNKNKINKISLDEIFFQLLIINDSKHKTRLIELKVSIIEL